MSWLLNTMHAELMEMILDEVCKDLVKTNCRRCFSPRCTCRVKSTGLFVYTVFPSVCTLARLNRTCRYLHELTTSRLYGYPVLPSVPASWYLTRTLLARPDLAQSVKFLVIGGHQARPGPGEKDFPEEVIQYYKERLAPFEHEEDQDIRSIDEPGQNSWKEKLVKCGGGEGVPLDLITSLCPNIEHLECRDNHSKPWLGQASTNKLKSIDIWLRVAGWPNEPGKVPGQALLRWAPNLEHITFTSLMMDHGDYTNYDGSTLQLHGVKRVVTRGSWLRRPDLARSDLAKLLTVFPNLEELTLGYWPTGVSLSPVQVADEFHRHLKPGKLKRFVADLTELVHLPENLGVRRYHEIPQATVMLAELGVEFICKLPARADGTAWY